jgi:hypothetical protein
MALVVSKHIELKTEISIKKVVDESKKVVDAEILNKITNKMATVNAEPNQKMKDITSKLFAPH